MTEEKKKQINSFEEKFNIERNEWSTKIESFSEMLKDLNRVPDLQVLLFSSLGKLADYRRALGNRYTKRELSIKEKRAAAVLEISESSVRYTSPEKNWLLESKTGEDQLVLNLISNHIEFLNDVYSIMDKMVYSVKYRLELENYRTGI